MNGATRSRRRLIDAFRSLRQRILHPGNSDDCTLLRHTLDSVNESIMVINTDYQVILMNRAAQQDFRGRDKPGPLHCYQLSHNRDAPCNSTAHPCPLEQVRQTLLPATMIHEHLREDGELRLYEIRAAPLLGKNRNLTAIVESARDVTECKQAEGALRESEERYRQLVELSPDGIGVQYEDKIVFINTAGMHLLGADNPEQLVGKTVMELGLPDMRELASRHHKHGETGGATPLFETEVRRLDGVTIDVEIAVITFDYHSKTAIQAIFRDISKRKSAEKALRQSEQRYRRLNDENLELAEGLQRQSKRQRELLKGLIAAQENERQRLARELHDELGQALGGLALQLGLLQQHIGADPDRARSQLEDIQSVVTETTDRMYDLILDLRPSVLDDLGLVAAVRTYADRLLTDSGLTLELDAAQLADRLPPSLETALYRVVQEAVSNVLRHAEASHVYISLARHNSVLDCEIRDDGRGFNTATISSTASSPRGLGIMGMRERVSQCGGQMAIASQIGHGTRISIHVPLAEG